MKSRRLLLRSDRGVSLVLITLSMFMLLGAAAIAIDLAALRYDLRAEQLATDAAATAGAIQINPISGSDAQAGCETAWQYLLLNLEDEGGVITPPNCATFSGVCNPGTFRSTTASAGAYDFVIGHPVPDNHEWMTDQMIDSDIDGGPCQRLGVSAERTRALTFARALGFDDASTDARSVARIAVRPGEGELVPLVILEPIGCNALTVSGGGVSTAYVTVESFSDVPGIIAVDSDGSKTSNPNRCGIMDWTMDVVTNNDRGWIRAIPVVADDIPAAILSYALSGAPGANPLRAFDNQDIEPNGPTLSSSDPPSTWWRLSPTPIPTTRRITRAPIDWRYNCKQNYDDYPLDLASPGVGIPIDDCPTHGAEDPHIDQLIAQYGGSGNPGSFQRWSDSHPCFLNNAGVIAESGDWWIDCPGGFTINQATIVTLDNGDVVFDGGVDIGSTGELHVNPSQSADRVVFLRSGDLTKGGGDSKLTLRRTLVYLETGRVDVGGGSAADSLQWIAPLAGDFEDLALWAEAALAFRISGQGGNRLEGTFFTPMANPFTLTGQATQFQLTAQFLTRRLDISGQGQVRMTPDPERTTRIPIRGVMLIR